MFCGLLEELEETGFVAQNDAIDHRQHFAILRRSNFSRSTTSGNVADHNQPATSTVVAGVRPG